ncbi:MAG: hypothetical protein ABI416_12385 [Ginsengibacter sp.]
MNIILITGARAPAALEMARSFFKAGHKVIMADSMCFTIARWSNTVAKYYRLPSPRYKAAEYIHELKRIISNENITHLVPTCEEVFYLSAQKEKLNCIVWTSGSELMNNLHNKYIFSRFGSCYFSIPETKLVKDFSNWADSESFVFKPVYSRFATQTIIGKKMFANDFDESSGERWIAQKRVFGKEICIYSIWENGVLKAYAAYHPLYRAGKGSGIFFEPVADAPTYELVKEFGTSIKYNGQLCFDVIIDRDKKPYFIECNPRATSGVHLINEAIARCFLENDLFIFKGAQEYSIKYALAILYPFSFFRKRVRASKDVIFSRQDKLPFLLQILSFFEIAYIKFSKRLSWLEATTGDIEWNGL